MFCFILFLKGKKTMRNSSAVLLLWAVNRMYWPISSLVLEEKIQMRVKPVAKMGKKSWIPVIIIIENWDKEQKSKNDNFLAFRMFCLFHRKIEEETLGWRKARKGKARKVGRVNGFDAKGLKQLLILPTFLKGFRPTEVILTFLYPSRLDNFPFSNG